MLTIDISCPACEAPVGRNCRGAGTVTCPERVRASVKDTVVRDSIYEAAKRLGGEPWIPKSWTMQQLNEWWIEAQPSLVREH